MQAGSAMEPSTSSAAEPESAAAAHNPHPHHHRRRRPRHRHHHGHGQHDDDDAAAGSESEEGEQQEMDGISDGHQKDAHDHGSLLPIPVPVAVPAASPLRPLRIDPPPRSPGPLRTSYESGSGTPIGRSPSRRRQERRVKAAKAAAGRTRKRVLVGIFLMGAMVGAYWLPRLFPNFYLRWMIPLPAFNISAVLPAALGDVNATIINDVWSAW
jgi:hypothetical protein